MISEGVTVPSDLYMQLRRAALAAVPDPTSGIFTSGLLNDVFGGQPEFWAYGTLVADKIKDGTKLFLLGDKWMASFGEIIITF